MAVFNNTYLLMRHGQSKANVAGKIVSAPEVGCTEYGLTEVGQGQARAAAARLLGEGGERVGRVVTSDFTRARETALIAAEVLGAPAPAEDVRLRERYFGDLDLGAHDQYAKVWERDAASCTHTEFNVESTASVRRRALGLIADLEGSCTGTVIILVAHGDTLQILSTAFHGLRPGRHRELPHHETGDIKLLVQQGAPVPEEVRQG
eukprot:TRINITY_DN12922_c0_g1_i3.p1 TRINITY_DN12922_c0_g1~~TRINITY_DN12922_c0_g1_i3.p1  ORF type:complete len:206 (+),score=59.76 TRINITY_DN12922_c0_g1_i3:78-695(+)